jgi:hypothetical protein
MKRPPLPCGMTRKEVMDGLREIKRLAEAHEKRKDPAFRRWPDLDTLLDYVDRHGLPSNGDEATPEWDRLQAENARQKDAIEKAYRFLCSDQWDSEIDAMLTLLKSILEEPR